MRETELICVKAVMIGIELDHSGEDNSMYATLELCFLVVYMLELLLNMFGFGLLFFVDMWNWYHWLRMHAGDSWPPCRLDILIVASCVVDLMLGDSSSGLPIMRLLRVLRMILRMSRLLKVITVAEKFVLLVESFALGMKSKRRHVDLVHVPGLSAHVIPGAFSAFVILGLTLYIFAVIGCGEHLVWQYVLTSTCTYRNLQRPGAAT